MNISPENHDDLIDGVELNIEINTMSHSGINSQSVSQIELDFKIEEKTYNILLDNFIIMLHGFEDYPERLEYADENIRISPQVGLEEAVKNFIKSEIINFGPKEFVDLLTKEV